jgi:citrate lyase subunit alpha / citrate CoA-transferase
VTLSAKQAFQRKTKLLADLEAAVDACSLRDGAVISFHHHLRNGDGVLNAVMEAVSRRGLKEITVAATSLFAAHAPLVRHIEAGVVTGVSAGFIAGPVAAAISKGLLPQPARLLTHGGRARAIEAGEIAIDVAFVAAPSADALGNINGVEGPSACGALGYPQVDVAHAKRVVAITDHLLLYPACPIAIGQEDVDFVVATQSIGDAEGIVSGTTRPTTEPTGLAIADLAARVIDASGLLVEGFSFQTGAGGVSLAAAAHVRRLMAERGVVGSFASGGITGQHVAMLEEGLFRTLLDVQCFDLEAVRSFSRNPRHMAMSASRYANPHARGAVVDQLDAVILGATEVDRDFNVNVTTGSNGVIMGGSGGHADTAAGAKLAIVTSRLTAGGYPKFVERVRTITTPGQTVDVVVTQVGLAVNPARTDLSDRLTNAGLPVVSMDELVARAAAQAERRATRREEGRTVAVVEYRDGAVIDTVPQAPA